MAGQPVVKLWTQKLKRNPGSTTTDLMRKINKRTKFSGGRSTIKKQSIQGLTRHLQNHDLLVRDKEINEPATGRGGEERAGEETTGEGEERIREWQTRCD